METGKELGLSGQQVHSRLRQIGHCKRTLFHRRR